ncbi:MAG: hypothetical protein GXP55_06245 [Deltaproteobacteria bacterium]|nr:hypothetical protein [Deltaproteobacteria bacterium]
MSQSRLERARERLWRGRRLRGTATEEARALIEQALALFTAEDHSRGRADCLAELSLFALAAVEFPEALRLLERAVGLYSRAGDDEGAGLGLYWAGVAALAADDEARAKSCLLSALPALAAYDRTSEQRGAEEMLGGLAFDADELDEAAGRFASALALLPDETDPLGPSRLRAALARVRRQAGQSREALELARPSTTRERSCHPEATPRPACC